jgi:hypothetical protein
MMRTRSIDLAAYLHLCGIAPDEVRLDERFKVREFRFETSDLLRAAVVAFEDGTAMVPAKQYIEARAAMKALGPRRKDHRAVENQRRALDSAVAQTGVQR